jgi:hypothetical protein
MLVNTPYSVFADTLLVAAGNAMNDQHDIPEQEFDIARSHLTPLTIHHFDAKPGTDDEPVVVAGLLSAHLIAARLDRAQAAIAEELLDILARTVRSSERGNDHLALSRNVVDLIPLLEQQNPYAAHLDELAGALRRRSKQRIATFGAMTRRALRDGPDRRLLAQAWLTLTHRPWHDPTWF